MESARENSSSGDLRTSPDATNLGEFQQTSPLTEQAHGSTNINHLGNNTTPPLSLSSPQNPFLDSPNDHAYQPSPGNPFQDQTSTNNKANNVAAEFSDDDIPISSSGSNFEPNTNKGPEIQNPPMQVMERQGDSSTNPSYTFPSHVFARNNTNNALVEWSTASNESLFSIYMGNMSFSNEIPNFSGGNNKSTELDKPYEMPMPDQPPNVETSPSPQPPNAATSQSPQPPTAPVITTPVNKFNDISQRTAEMHVECSKAKATEAKAAETMREVIMETSKTNEDVGKGGDDKNSNARRQSDGSTQSFAFQSVSSKGEEKQKQQKQSSERKETANAVDEPSKSNTNPPSKGWLSCFPCCS
ncbi:hypothetical protein TanjilG_18473 [Lupinus angustifolius]|uniref:Uncharacterized protein n=1 Tax=Lupinus angustifolius TaxID=3871 RepID=A0A4P1RX43_LUPAN|nr:PREDICTED: putative uncharacterized protein DDB_G0286901 [Lupinus angustifolius]XP_019438912.1 PREDICTED: putative uncharacterized protein DDB_G0286901 [Lupinus angustifolius]OIW19663.1 hypothetical protein TanjilG_18473 [Lupinus angustifolius]